MGLPQRTCACGKLIYPTAGEAIKIAQQHGGRHKGGLREPYRCRIPGGRGNWHLSSSNYRDTHISRGKRRRRVA